ncbi:MAG: DUF5320 domain-containing protein [Planctomycetes bacterium]|nr:DUF5320 domain-containing protein [Planctomycetota bacterium]
MPGGDRTGPAGMGSMTGRAAGFCAGYPVPGYMNPIGGRGYWGGGRGRGWRNRAYAAGFPGWAPAGFGYQPTFADEGQELAGLKQQAEFLQNSLSQINERMEEIERKSKD